MTTLNDTEKDEIRSLLLGRKAVKIDDTTLTLDNGIVLTFEGNEGCGGCPSGHYEVIDLNGVDNIITNVIFDEAVNSYGDPIMYKIFVFADNTKINLLTVEGDIGNGYYGSGYTISVTDLN